MSLLTKLCSLHVRFMHLSVLNEVVSLVSVLLMYWIAWKVWKFMLLCPYMNACKVSFRLLFGGGHWGMKLYCPCVEKLKELWLKLEGLNDEDWEFGFCL